MTECLQLLKDTRNKEIMKLGTLFLFAIYLSFDICYGNQDPCSSYKLLPRANYRGGKCTYNADKATCDRDLKTSWYRALAGPRDILIQNTPAPMLTCGTKTPYWMDGVFPDVSDGSVTKPVCHASLISSCAGKTHIKVKNCSTFLVYELSQLPSCSEAYCFGKDDPCPPFDPCDIYEHTPLHFDNNKIKVSEVDIKCKSTDASKWYSFTGGEEILSVLNQVNRNCTSNEFIWIKGAPTAMSNGIANYTVCVQRGNNTCVEVKYILSKQCRNYKVYTLPDMSKLSACEHLCLDTSGTEYGWYTYRINKAGIIDKQDDATKEPDGPKCPADCLWVIGLVAGVVIGAVAATVVVFKMMKNRTRRKKVGSSTGSIKPTFAKEYVLKK